MTSYLGVFVIATVTVVLTTVSSAQLPSSWPKGTYALPMADSGCPNSHYDWKTGWRYQDTQDFLAGNKWSKPIHLMGPWSASNVQQNFCVKTTHEMAGGSDPDWGSGQYCIFKKGTLCPDRFSEGWILWDDQDLVNNNDYSGELPEGVYDRDTKMYFCCREDGDEGTPLTLPVDQPFFLFRKNGHCQSVDRMTMVEQWFKWDGEDDLIDLTKYKGGIVPDLDSKGNDHKLIYCYYY